MLNAPYLLSSQRRGPPAHHPTPSSSTSPPPRSCSKVNGVDSSSELKGLDSRDPRARGPLIEEAIHLVASTAGRGTLGRWRSSARRIRFQVRRWASQFVLGTAGSKTTMTHERTRERVHHDVRRSPSRCSRRRATRRRRGRRDDDAIKVRGGCSGSGLGVLDWARFEIKSLVELIYQIF